MTDELGAAVRAEGPLRPLTPSNPERSRRAAAGRPRLLGPAAAAAAAAPLRAPTVSMLLVARCARGACCARLELMSCALGAGLSPVFSPSTACTWGSPANG